MEQNVTEDSNGKGKKGKKGREGEGKRKVKIIK